MDDLAYTYQIRPFGKGSFTLGTRKGCNELIEKADKGRDRG